MTQYVLNNIQDGIWWNTDTYDSCEDAKREAADQYRSACQGDSTDLFLAGTKDTVKDYCYIGEKCPFDYLVDGDIIIEMIQDELAQLGLEDVADNFDYIAQTEIDDLSDIMTNAFIGWCKKHWHYSDIYSVVNIEKLYVGDEK